MEDIFELSVSNKERDFVKAGCKTGSDVAINLAEVFSNIPYIGSIVNLGILGSKYIERRFINKAAKFLKKDMDIPLEQKQKFLSGLTQNDRKRISDYIMQYLLRAEDDEKAELMGYIYEESVYGRINHETLLRLCSIIDRVFLYDLRNLPKYVNDNTEESIASNNFINLGLIDNFVGGRWVDEPKYRLNDIGLKLYEILKKNNWFTNEVEPIDEEDGDKS